MPCTRRYLIFKSTRAWTRRASWRAPKILWRRRALSPLRAWWLRFSRNSSFVGSCAKTYAPERVLTSSRSHFHRSSSLPRTFHRKISHPWRRVARSSRSLGRVPEACEHPSWRTRRTTRASSSNHHLPKPAFCIFVLVSRYVYDSARAVFRKKDSPLSSSSPRPDLSILHPFQLRQSLHDRTLTRVLQLPAEYELVHEQIHLLKVEHEVELAHVGKEVIQHLDE